MTQVTKRHESGHEETQTQAFWDDVAGRHPDIAALYVEVSRKTISTPPEVAAKAEKPAKAEKSN